MSAVPQSGGTPLTRRLAERICAFDWTMVTPNALARARMAIADTIGVTLAGIDEPCTAILRRTPGVATAPGNALIFGTHQRTSALEASLVNGTASHALDYDDFSSVLGGHQSVPLVTMLFALGDERKLSGRQLLTAYILGVEVESRIARAVHYHHYDKGWHPTSTLGIFGAAAAAAHVLGLDEERTATALAAAASFASGLKANFGTMMKPLHVGHCARDGLMAALLSKAGYDANPAVFEHHQGFLNVFNGPGTFDAEKMFENWAEPLEIEHSTIVLKRFACCGSTHPAIVAMLRLAREENLRPDDVAKLDVMPHRRRLRHTNNPNPQTVLEAKFSVQYVTARALLDGAVRLKDFETGAPQEAPVRALLARTEAQPHPGMPDDSPDQWGAEVIATLRDGRRLSRRVNDLIREAGPDLMTREELWAKFEDCASRALPRTRVAALFELLETLDSLDSVSAVTQLMDTGEPGEAAQQRPLAAASAR